MRKHSNNKSKKKKCSVNKLKNKKRRAKYIKINCVNKQKKKTIKCKFHFQFQ